MNKVQYILRLHHRPGTHAQVMLNGIPFYDEAPDGLVSPIGGITHALVPGENHITVDLLPSAPDPQGAPPHFALILSKLEGEGPDPEKFYEWEYPMHPRQAGLEPIIPWAHAHSFLPQGEIPKPTYLSAPPADFPREGTPQQRAAVRELHDAFEKRDGGRFQESMRVRVDEYERAYGENPQLRKESVDKLAEPWVMDPYAEDELVFDRYLDGRVARVRRVTGRPVINATHRDEPFQTWGPDELFLTQVDGRWRVFR